MKRFFAVLTLFLLVGCGPSVTATPAPTLTSIPPTGTPVTGRLFQVSDPLSIVNYEAVLQLGGAKIGGTFAIRGQTIKAVPDPSDTSKYFLEIDIRFDGNSVTGANDLIVGALKSNLETDKFPYGQLLGKSKESNVLGEQAVSVNLEGTLELHGVQRPFTLPVQVTVTKTQLSATGSTTIDLFDYKVNVPTAIMKSQITFTAKVIAAETP